MGKDETCGADAVTVGKHTAMLEQLTDDMHEVRAEVKEISRKLSYQDGANETHKIVAPKIAPSTNLKSDTKMMFALTTAIVTLTFDLVIKVIEAIGKVIH